MRGLEDIYPTTLTISFAISLWDSLFRVPHTFLTPDTHLAGFSFPTLLGLFNPHFACLFSPVQTSAGMLPVSLPCLSQYCFQLTFLYGFMLQIYRYTSKKSPPLVGFPAPVPPRRLLHNNYSTTVWLMIVWVCQLVGRNHI